MTTCLQVLQLVQCVWIAGLENGVKTATKTFMHQLLGLGFSDLATAPGSCQPSERFGDLTKIRRHWASSSALIIVKVIAIIYETGTPDDVF